MLRKPLAEALTDKLVSELGAEYRAVSFRSSGAGCINETYQAYGPRLEPLFLKIGSADYMDMYEKEVKGLMLLQQCEAIRVPQVRFAQQLQNHAVMVMEFVELQPVRGNNARAFGEALAQLHSVTANQFGLDHCNYIGRTPQINRWNENWWDFYCECRLLPQAKLAQAKGLRSSVIKKLHHLIEAAPISMASHQPEASLLHGDLWNGNIAVDATGKATLYDPAVYYGDAETDLAMSKMFGAMPAQTYEAYHNVLPQKQGHKLRQALYDLYHWLNHFNLFGVTYLGQVEQTLETVLLELE